MITATLENWRVEYIGISSIMIGDNNFRLIGECFGDNKNRFRDGDVIITSLAMKYNPEEETVETLNSVYKLGKAENENESAFLKEITA